MAMNTTVMYGCYPMDGQPWINPPPDRWYPAPVVPYTPVEVIITHKDKTTAEIDRKLEELKRQLTILEAQIAMLEELKKAVDDGPTETTP